MAKYKKLALIMLFSFCCFFSASLFLHSEKFTQVFGTKEEKNIVLLVPQTPSRANIAVLTQGEPDISILENTGIEYFPDILKNSSYLILNFFREQEILKEFHYRWIVHNILTVFPKRVLRN
ncbi:MAG TPA: hypothetical protein VIG61_07100 [Fusobacterium sp.]|uniref:hypothetical protein n=1 Tax=Fusobacterium sp. TaxID=68766 RepID=UPI002F41B98B